MDSGPNQWISGAFARRLIVLPALVVALSLALTGVASAQPTTPFQASVTFKGTKPFFKAGSCSNGAFFCGTANIAGYGAASWNLYDGVPTVVESPCGSSNTATTYFTLASDPGSTLVLDENLTLCGLGHDGAAYRGYFAGGPNKWGFPYMILGAWSTADCSTSPPPPTGEPACSTGQFQGLSGSGNDTVHVSGAHIAGTYTGTLG